MKEVINITKALADENRVKILMFLGNGELCLCQIIEMLHLSPSTVSKHVAVLSRAGLVERRKEGRWHYYSLSVRSKSEAVKSAIRWLKKVLAEDKGVKKNIKKLKSVIKKDKKALCRHYSK